MQDNAKPGPGKGRTALPRVAYVSMEIALDAEIPTYSGGLGVLAGDLLRSAADLAVPLVGVTLASRGGYFRQTLVDGAQKEQPQFWDPANFAQALSAKVLVRIAGRDVWIACWQYLLPSLCRSGGDVPVFLLDTDLPENHPDDRVLSHFLYGGDELYRLKQEIVLGIGGVRMLAELGRCIFTTHTPVPAGHDQFAYATALECLGGVVEEPVLREYGGAERLNMTQLALHLSGWSTESRSGTRRHRACCSRATKFTR